MPSLFSLTLCSLDVKDTNKVVLNMSLTFIEYNKAPSDFTFKVFIGQLIKHFFLITYSFLSVFDIRKMPLLREMPNHQLPGPGKTTLLENH